MFLSGNEAVAHAVRLSRPEVIAAYPITPQTTVVERLSEMVDSGELVSEFSHVESEHSALSLVMGAAAMGVRSFTATSSQGLLYMAEVLWYASGGRFPLVMMNANRALALPWNIYGDQSDSTAMHASGWIQAYAENAQEALEMTIQAYAVAERPDVSTPVMVNLDGFFLTHTYEAVTVPDQEAVDAWLPTRNFNAVMSLDSPLSIAMTAGPGDYAIFKDRQHRDMKKAALAICEESKRWALAFGGQGQSLVEGYRLEGAAYVLVTLGSVAGLARDVIDSLRSDGFPCGLVRIRYLVPFPAKEIFELLDSIGPDLKALGVLEKDVTIGSRGAVATELLSSLYVNSCTIPVRGYVGGLGGQDITARDIGFLFRDLEAHPSMLDGECIMLGLENRFNGIA